MVTVNSEIIAGIAIAMMAIIFIGAGELNSTWGAIIPADIVIAAIGFSTLGLGLWTAKYNEKNSIHTHHH